MKAVMLKGPGEIGIGEINKPEFKDGYALIKIKAMGICGSDVTAFRGANPTNNYPIVIGHELGGVIEQINEDNANHLKVGDRVAVYPFTSCGYCYPCSQGKTNCCEHIQTIGVHINGGMTDYLLHPQDLLFKVPDNLPMELAPMGEPMAISLHCLHRAELKKDQFIAINGAGTIGLLGALCARDVFHAKPILIDPVQERLDLAKNLGIEHVITPDKAVDYISEVTGGRMAEVVMEASGANAAIRAGLDQVAYTGKIVMTGWPKQATLLPTDIITKKEIDLLGGRNSTFEIGEALDIMANNIVDVRPIISKTVTLDEVPQAVRDLSDHPGRYLKITVRNED